jgi:ABC-type polysaccharide/polyol phosphate export permease
MREPLAEIVRSRELLMELTLRELRIRYKQTALGAAWALFTPVLMMLLFTQIFARMAGKGLDLGDVPYPIFVYCGLMPWQFFAASIKGATESLTRNNRLVSKVYMPREVFPLSTVLAALVDFAVASIVLVGLMLWYHWFPGPVAKPFEIHTGTLWCLPLVIFVQTMFIAGLALVLSMGNLFYRDVKYVLEVVMLVWMFATSVVYPIKPEMIGGWGWLLALNPLTPMIDAYRQVLLHGQLPDSMGFGYATIVAGLLCAYGLRWFHEAEYLFAERI